MKTDAEVRHDVLAELEHEPTVYATEIRASVLNGVVTLTGTAMSFREEWATEQAVLGVEGVKAVVDEIDVGPVPGRGQSDAQIARSALEALKASIYVPEDRVTVKVNQGRVTLEGIVEWRYQREAAEKAVTRMIGVKGVENLIRVGPSVKSAEAREKIRETLHRTAAMF
jgi:osmotically-inducible protein OsmY